MKDEVQTKGKGSEEENAILGKNLTNLYWNFERHIVEKMVIMKIYK